MKNVAIDAGPLTSGHSVRGIGVNTRELIGAINKLRGKEIKLSPVDFKTEGLERYHLLHYPYFHPYSLTLPLIKKGKTLVTIHDLIYLVYPKAYPGGIKGQIKLFLLKYLIKKVDGILTISETSKKDIIQFLGVEPGKIHVVHLAPRDIFHQSASSERKKEIGKKYNLPKKFVLYVGDINYNKNINTLIEACKMARVTLVIAGKQATDIENLGMTLVSLKGPKDWIRYLFNVPHPELAHIKKIADMFKKNPNIIRLGYISDEDLAVVYKLASLYCQPSLYEGFGLPVLEAMASGTPVVASNIKAHKEIAGQSVVYADPENPKDLAEKLAKVIDDFKLRKKLIGKANKKIKEYSWEKTAQKTLYVYEKVIG